MEMWRGTGASIGGESLSWVDIAWLPLLHRADIIRRRRCYDFLSGRPKLMAWQERLLSTGLAERSVAADFEAAFAAFYLSDQTFLGRGEAVEDCAFSQACATDRCC